MSKIAKIDAAMVYSLRIYSLNAEGLIIATLHVHASIQATVYINHMYIMYKDLQSTKSMEHFDSRSSTQLSVLNIQGMKVSYTELHCTFNEHAELGNCHAKTHAAKANAISHCGAFVLDKRYYGVL